MNKDTHRRFSWAVTRTRRWQAVRHAVLERDGWACTNCGSRRRLEVHHKVSVRMNPALGFDPGNCKVLCSSCHTFITNAEIRGKQPDPQRQEWRKAVSELEAKPSSNTRKTLCLNL